MKGPTQIVIQKEIPWNSKVFVLLLKIFFADRNCFIFKWKFLVPQYCSIKL